MKRASYILFTLVAGIVCTATAANAAPINPAIRAAASQLRLSAGALHQKYVEDDSADVVPTSYVDKETGNIPAFAFDYSVVSPTGVYSKLHFLYAWGKTDYDGYLQTMTYAGSSFTPHASETDNKLFDTRGNLGYMIGVGSRVAIAPEIELGYTRWKREVLGTGGSSQTYDTYRYGLGLEVDVAATDRLVFTFEGIYGRQHTDINSTYLDESLGTNAYTRLAAGVDYRLTDRVHLGFRTTRVHYEFDQSDVGRYGFYEPSSETTHTRFMASIGWSML